MWAFLAIVCDFFHFICIFEDTYNEWNSNLDVLRSIFRHEFIASISIWNQQKSVCHPIMAQFIFLILKKHEQKIMVYRFYPNISPVNGHFANFPYHKALRAFGKHITRTKCFLFNKYFGTFSSGNVWLNLFNWFCSAFGPDGNSVIGKLILNINEIFYP